MNEKQKKLLAKWIKGYLLIIAIFSVIYIFDPSLPTIVLIILFGNLIKGKTDNADWGTIRQEIKDYVAYANKHKRMFGALTLIYAVFPLLIFLRAKENNFIIQTDSKGDFILTIILLIPFLIFDLGYKISILKENANDT